MRVLAGKISAIVTTAYARISVSRLGILFLLLTFAHCFAQGVVQVALLRSDVNLRSSLVHTTKAAGVPSNQIPWLDPLGHGQYDLKVCTRIPLRGVNTTTACTSLFNTNTGNSYGGDGVNLTAYPMTEIAVQTLTTIAWSPSEVATTTPGSSAIDHVHGADLMYNDGSRTALLSGTCSLTMLWAQNLVGSFEDEDVALLGAQFWMLVVSFIAVLYRSIPQIVAVFCVRLIATMWSAYTVCRVTQYKPLFQILYVGPRAPCQFDFFDSFFTIRMPLAITSLVLNTTALTFEGYMGRKLVKAFDVLIFQRVVPKASVLKIYRYFLAVFVLLQLDVVFMMSAIGLWATWLVYAIGELTKNKSLYVALFVASMNALLPWLATGWFSVRREMKTLMIVFLLMDFAYLVLWATMLRTDVFLWTFLQWPFFACLTCISFVLLFITGSFGIICRLNFGEGLAEYFHVETVLAEANFAPGLFEEDTGSSDEKSMHKPTAVPAAEMYKNCELSEIGLGPVIVIGRV